MTKTFSTNYGEPLSAESQKLVNDVRLKITQPLHPKFDKDFNVYRFILSAERLYKNRKDIVEHAAKVLNQHLRIRKCWKLDELPDVAFEENPLFKYRFLPFGQIQEFTDKNNRLLWYIEYKTISVEGIAHGMQTSQSCRYQFWEFEHLLRRVNEQEEKTGCLSSLRHIVDMNGYEINPFTMLFVSSGTLSYYSQLFHYDNYPELVYPIELVNIAKWIHVPYKLIKTVMPAGFSDRFRLHDGNFLQTLTTEIDPEHIPETLGGKRSGITCTPAEPLSAERHWKPTSEAVLKMLETITIASKKSKIFRINVAENEKPLVSWYFRTDGDVYFGVFYEPPAVNGTIKSGKEEKDFDVESREMIYPWLRLSAKIVHEQDAFECSRPGSYYIVFCNRTWLQKRNIDVVVHLTEPLTNVTKRCYQDGTQSPLSDANDSLLNLLNLTPDNHFPSGHM